MPSSFLAGFCPACQEVLAPYALACPGCDEELVPVNITDAPDHVIAGATEAIENGSVLRFGMDHPVDHALLLADLILRSARAA